MARRPSEKVKPVADEILLVPKRAVVEPGYLPNRSPARSTKATKPRRRPKKWVVAESVVEPFEGYDGFMVRTALIRPRGYERQTAPFIGGPEQAARFCLHMAHYDQEHMCVLALNSQNRLLAIFEAAKGGTSSMELGVHHVIKVPLLAGAPGAVVVHNHPSGDPTPSNEDVETTAAMKLAFRCIGITLADSMVVATAGWASILHGDRGSFAVW